MGLLNPDQRGQSVFFSPMKIAKKREEMAENEARLERERLQLEAEKQAIKVKKAASRQLKYEVREARKRERVRKWEEVAEIKAMRQRERARLRIEKLSQEALKTPYKLPTKRKYIRKVNSSQTTILGGGSEGVGSEVKSRSGRQIKTPARFLT